MNMDSARFNPIACTRSMTSPVEGSLEGRSSISRTSGPPSLWNCTIRGIVFPPDSYEVRGRRSSPTASRILAPVSYDVGRGRPDSRVLEVIHVSTWVYRFGRPPDLMWPTEGPIVLGLLFRGWDLFAVVSRPLTVASYSTTCSHAGYQARCEFPDHDAS